MEDKSRPSARLEDTWRGIGGLSSGDDRENVCVEGVDHSGSKSCYRPPYRIRPSPPGFLSPQLMHLQRIQRNLTLLLLDTSSITAA